MRAFEFFQLLKIYFDVPFKRHLYLMKKPKTPKLKKSNFPKIALKSFSAKNVFCIFKTKTF